MAIRFNISDTHRWLKRNGLITFSESNLIDEIVLGTVGARNPKNQMCSETDFNLKTLADNLGITTNHVYARLKTLNQKYLVLRKHSDYSGCEILGLNPYFWGQILIDKSHAVERARTLKCVVNNVQKMEQPRTENGPSRYKICTNRVQKEKLTRPFSQEIIEEKAPLESYRRVKKSLEGELDEIDLENLSPIWRKFAVLGGSS